MEIVSTDALERILTGYGGYWRHGSLRRCHPVAVGAFLSGGMYVGRDAWPEDRCLCLGYHVGGTLVGGM